jgi:ribonuclease HII
LDFAVAQRSAAIIDAYGIVTAINAAMERALCTLERRHTMLRCHLDSEGISPRTDLGEVESHKKTLPNSTIDRTMRRNLWEQSVVKLDGGLLAPGRYIHQETIIKGDATELVIGLASIVAKVTRDRHMVRLGAKDEFRVYDFGTHKGYGTKAHRSAIARHGVSPVHRRTFCRNIESVV